jgi:regulator of sigma E protease
MSVLKVILIILEVLLLFNLLIFVHELGHFLAARWRGLKIERFAIWFGKPVWSRHINGVEYALGWIPAGGYVALPQMATMEAIEGKAEDGAVEELPPVSPLDKIIVAFAGPLFSFLLALFFAVVVWMVGRPVDLSSSSTTIGWVDSDGPAWEAGIRPGDEILEVDGHPVTHFSGMTQSSIMWRVVSSEGDTIPIKYLRDGETHMAYPAPVIAENKWYERKNLRKIRVAPSHPVIIGKVATNSPADRAGLTPGDEIIALNAEPIYSYIPILDAEESATNAEAAPFQLTVRRSGETFDVTVAPVRPLEPSDSPPSLGILELSLPENTQLIHPTPWEQVRTSVGQIVSTIRTVTSPHSDVGVQQLGGPVMIMRVYKNLFEAPEGWRLVIWFSVVLNVNLALLNLLPFPVLDGGHITLSLVEVIRRRPVSGRLLNYVQNGCALVLIGFMLYIAFFDTGDWVRSARADREVPVVFSPHTPDHN